MQQIYLQFCLDSCINILQVLMFVWPPVSELCFYGCRPPCHHMFWSFSWICGQEMLWHCVICTAMDVEYDVGNFIPFPSNAMVQWKYDYFVHIQVSKKTVGQIKILTFWNIILRIDLLLLGCCTRFLCTLIKWWSQLARTTIHPSPSNPPRWRTDQLNENHISKLNWRQIFPCQYIHVYPITIFTNYDIFPHG